MNKAFNNGQHGFYATTGGVITCGGSDSSNNGTWGYFAEKMAYLYTSGVTGSGNASGLHSPAQGSQGNTYAVNST